MPTTNISEPIFYTHSTGCGILQALTSRVQADIYLERIMFASSDLMQHGAGPIPKNYRICELEAVDGFPLTA